MSLKAITFDLWDTLFVDGSDEPKRSASGLAPKNEARTRVFYEFVQKNQPIMRQESDLIFKTIEEAFNLNWKQHSMTWSVRERMEIASKALALPNNQEGLEETIETLETMELQPAPSLLPRVPDILRQLATQYPLGIISDTIYSSGQTLRRMLEKEGILDCFSVLIFSDEHGHSKPHPSNFAKAASALGCEPKQLAHVGDRIPNDIEGAQAVGARGILCQAAIRRDRSGSQPDGIFSDYKQLPRVVQELKENAQ